MTQLLPSETLYHEQYVDGLQKALRGCMDAICYESEEEADKGKWALPFEVVIEAKKALADKRLPRVENERCPECDKPLEPHGACPQCGEYPTKPKWNTKLLKVVEAVVANAGMPTATFDDLYRQIEAERKTEEEARAIIAKVKGRAA